jgi:CheY-like chemotaxis protein
MNGWHTHKGVVFLVDDEADLRASTQDLLEDEGYFVLSARNGTEALARMRGISGAAVAIVDLVMPDMNGWELISALNSDPNLKIPVIVLSGQRSKRLDGAAKVLRKPYDPVQLVEAVRELCQQR